MVAERRCDESDANQDVLEPAALSQLVSRLSDVKEIITDLINKLQSEALAEANHKQDRDNELDLETQVETHSFKPEATVLPSSVLDDEVAELQADFCVNSGITHADHTAAQLSTERAQQRTVEHTQSLDPVKDVLVVMQKQMPVQRMVETPQLRFIDRIADDLSNVDRKGSNYQGCEVLFPSTDRDPTLQVVQTSMRTILTSEPIIRVSCLDTRRMRLRTPRLSHT